MFKAHSVGRVFANPVSIISTAIIALLVGAGAIFPNQAERISSLVQNRIFDSLSWFYLLSVGIIVGSILFLGVSRFGSLKLGPDDAEPDYPYVTWLAMLFAAGMGIGLMYFGVAEPILHYASPPEGEPGTIEAARQSMAITYFHWGIHAWSIYAIVGLSLAYYAYRYNLPLTIRSG